MSTASAFDALPSGSTAVVPFHRETNITVSGHARAHIGNVVNYELPEGAAQEMRELRLIMNKAVSECKQLHELLATDQPVGEQLLDIAHEPQEIYRILNTLTAYLDNNETDGKVIFVAQSEDLKASLTSCRSTVAAIASKIEAWRARVTSPKATEVSIMSRGEIEGCQTAILSQKMSLNMAICLFNLDQAQSTHEDYIALKEQLGIVLEHLEDLRAENRPKGLPHYDIHRRAVPIDLEYPMKKFLAESMSILTEAARRNDPSIVVSSYLGRQTTETAFWSCQESFSGPLETVVPVFIAGLPIRKLTDLTICVNLNDSVVEIKELILDRIGLENADFGLMCGNNILDSAASLRHYDVDRNTTLHCVSFRHNTFTPGHWADRPIPEVKILDTVISKQTQFSLSLPPGIAYKGWQIKQSFTKASPLAFIPYAFQLNLYDRELGRFVGDDDSVSGQTRRSVTKAMGAYLEFIRFEADDALAWLSKNLSIVDGGDHSGRRPADAGEAMDDVKRKRKRDLIRRLFKFGDSI